MVATTRPIFDQILNVIGSRNISTFFLNGPPGSGKSQYLKDLSENLPRSKVGIHSFGPYLVDWNNVPQLPRQVICEFREAGYLNSEPSQHLEFTEIFAWLATQLPANARDFVILIDLGKTNAINVREIAILFSGARRLEGEHHSSQARIHFVFGGFWNLYKLDQFYRERNVSFPYTVGYNFAFYQGLPEDATTQLVRQRRYDDFLPLHGEIIHELTDGHPRICNEILDNIPKNELSLRKILQVIQDIARTGAVGNLFLDTWIELPKEAKIFLADLLLKRHITAQVVPELRNQLVAAGLVKEATHGLSKYLTFRSWYIELLLRYRGIEIGISMPDKLSASIPEMMPEVGVINRIAYDAIHDIENQVRNFAVIQANLCKKPAQHFLDFEIRQRGKNINLLAESSKQRSETLTNVPLADVNPLIAFSYTRQLAEVVRYLANELNSESWREIASSIHRVADIRNSVMHNQLIDEDQLHSLFSLQNAIYEALNQIS